MKSRTEFAKRCVSGFMSLMLGAKQKINWNNKASYNTKDEFNLPAPTTGDDNEIGLLNRLAMHEAGHKKFSDMSLLSGVDELTMTFFNPLEDARIEALQMKEMPGADLILNNGWAGFMEKRRAELDLSDVDHQLWLIGVSCLFRAQATLGRFARVLPGDPLNKMTGEFIELANSLLRPDQAQALTEICRGIEDCQSSADALKLAERCVDVLKTPPQQQEQSCADDAAQEANEGCEAQGQQQNAAGSGAEAVAQGNATAEPGSDPVDPSQGNGTGQPCQDQASEGDDGQSNALQGQVPAGIDLSKLSESYQAQDVGQMFEQALANGYPQPEQAQSQEQIAPSAQELQLLQEALEQAQEEGLNQAQLLALAEQFLDEYDEQMLEMQAPLAPEPNAQQCATGAGSGGSESILGSLTPDVRLQGYVGHVTRVFMRALQDKRRKNLLPAKRGVRIIAKRVWRAEALGDMRLYRGRTQTSGIESSIMLLLDRSGSTEMILQEALNATMCCAQGLERMHTCKTAISLFPGADSQNCNYEPLMRFGESTKRVFKRLQGIGAYGGTPMAQAISHATVDLLERKTHKHVLGIITDGGPDNLYAAVEAIKMAQVKGIEVFGIGIGAHSRGIKALLERSELINDVSELGDALEKVFASDIEALAA